MCEAWISEKLTDTVILGQHQAVATVRGHLLLPDLVEQGVVAGHVIKQVLVGGPLQHGHLVVRGQQGGQGGEGRAVLLHRKVGDNTSLPMPEDEASADQNGDEGDPDGDCNWCDAPSAQMVLNER